MDDMLGIDPDVLLEWLQTGIGDERDLQLMALEQLCMLVLITDNIDRCFESCPPRTFIPALCNIFVDETSPDNVLEVTARAITYYLDLSPECSRRIIQVDGSIKAICSRLAAAELQERSSKDFAEQCVKLLERVCQRETMAVYEAGAINAMLTLVRNHRQDVHNDTIYSAMSVVVRLCGKMEPNDPDLGKCAESLGSLLESDDAKIVESSLRCFAALTDRFIRKMMDPAELATHCNLVEHLLLTLTLSNDENSTVTSNFLSIVLSLLSNLCRGSSLITEKVLSSPNMIKGISAVLTNKEERVVTDGLRLADLLLVLLCDGRSALPATFGVSGDFNSSGGSASGTERVHRQIIDAIRQKESSVLFDAIDSGQVDVNYCDDVGQSLCNWASAFGTIEMVQFLCDKGADVNKGHKSSSLHYAACFGRADIVKLLLQKGANPDLRDEDGKTALDKARERNDEDHIRVANILESPSVYMHSDDKSRKSGESSADRGKLAKNAELPNEELVKKVLQQLLPIFCEIFQKSLNGSVRRTTLSLMRKIVQNIGDFRCNEGSEICAEAESLMAVVVSILDQEENHEGQEQVLMIIGTLLEKDPELWITELVRLGVFERVEAMAKEPAKGLEQVIMEVDKEMAPRRNSVNAPTISIDAEMPQIEDVNEDEEEEEMMEGEKMEEGSSSKSAAQTASSAILQVVSKISGGVVSAEKEKKPTRTALVENTPYRWKEWRIGRGASSVFVWSDVLLIELPLQSNGWFRYLMDNDCHMQFVSGMASVEQCENEKNAERKEIVKRWKEVKKYFDDDSYMVPIYVLGIPSSSKKLEIPGWEIWSPRSSEIQIVSTSATTPDGQPNNMTTTIKDESGGYVFESTNGRKVSMMPESALPADFHTGWSCHGLSSRKMKFRVEIQRRKVQELAWRLWNDHLKAAHAKPREALVRLEKAAMTIENAVRTARAMRVSKHKNAKQPRIERVQDLVSAMRVVHESIVDERRLSTFELSVSGIVPALFSLLSLIESAPASYPASIFKETFASGDSLSLLATKMVAVLESNERFPQYLYDTPGGSALGLQLLSRRVRAKLEYAKSDNDSQLIDKTGKALKIEPLADVAQIRAFLLKMVAKQWYDRERSTYHYVKMIQDAKEKKEPLSFRYSSDFDDQGLMYWIGTNGRSTGEWTNPASVGLVKVWCSDARQPFGKPEDILSRDTNPINCHTSDDKNASFTIDLGLMVVPSAYSLRHARGYGRSALRNWLIQGSTDRESWEVLWTHVDDAALTEPGSTATWHLKEKAKKAYRYLRIAQNGKNSSGHTYYVSISGFEIYGDVVDSVTEPLKGGDEGRKEKEQPSTSASSSDGVKTRQRASLKMASVSTPLSRFARNSPAAGSSGNQNSSANIGKKSMSTTNLVDERQKAAAASVATTGQAASAESLQHQTPSLENLLARAMPQTFGRIAENQEEEEEQQQTSVATEDGSTTTMEEESAEKLSVSAPDLARQRKSERFKNEEEEMEEDEEDEEEEEETMDEEEEDEEEEEEEKRGTHGMYNKIRDIFVGESTSTPTSAAAASATTQPAPVQGTSKNTKKKMTSSVFRQKMSDLFRGKHPKSNLFEQAVGQMEMDEFMDEEEYYDYSEGNDDDIEMELANQLGIPPESFVSVLSGRAPPVAWKQALQFTRLVLGGRERSNRGGSSSSRGAHWEEEMLVKCNYPSLIPAYDPRPGRTNVNPTLEIELPAVVSESAQSKGGDENSPKVRLFLRGPNMTGVENVTVEMTDEQASLFKYMQMINNSVNWATKSDKSRRIWEPTYVILYANANEKCRVETSKIPTEEDTTPIQVNQCLEVIGLLSRIQQMLPEAEISPNVFISDKLTMKLTQVLNDAVVVAARAIPDWCSRLVYKFPCLFSVETRNVYMQATAFGVSRTIVWLQQRRDALIERTRGAQTANSATRQERYHEYRVGRLRHERVKITRSEEMLLDQAVRLMKFHASRKAILEIEYTNEEGTGLGPTLEFYALVAAELQRKALAIWICDDHEEQPKGEEEKEVDLGEGKKPAGYYVRRTGGLFPAPLPPHTDEVKRASEMFRVLGIFLAKVLQDGRLVDLPLSRPFLKLLVHPNVNEAELVNPEKVLSLDDFEEVNPVKGSFLKELRALAQRKRAIENEPNLDQLAKRRKIGELKLQMKGTTCRVEDLALSFTVNAPSKVFEYDEMELVDGGSEIDLTMDNIEQYVEKCEEFYLNTGILDQMRAFREGFDRVFPLRALGAYSPEEVQRLLSGEQCPEWTREDVLNYTEPKLGYTRESPGFLRFVEVMVGLSPQERKSFLQFATGCSSLPPGGLANLHPRLTIVRKIESGDGSYPSVNTCVHYLKLPEYSSADILRERLLTAVNEKGFHLN